MGDHRDDEKELCKKTPIASFSLGAERDFVLKHVDRKKNKLDPVKIMLSVVVVCWVAERPSR